MDEMTALLVRLASARVQSRDASNIKTTMLRELEANPAYSAAIAAKQAADEQIVALEEQVHELGKSCWARTGDKNICPGVKIRMINGISYDKVTALDWARSNLQEALTLDAKFFETYAKGVMTTKPVPGVTLTQEPQVTIAKDLDAYLIPEVETIP